MSTRGPNSGFGVERAACPATARLEDDDRRLSGTPRAGLGRTGSEGILRARQGGRMNATVARKTALLGLAFSLLAGSALTGCATSSEAANKLTKLRANAHTDANFLTCSHVRMADAVLDWFDAAPTSKQFVANGGRMLEEVTSSFQIDSLLFLELGDRQKHDLVIQTALDTNEMAQDVGGLIGITASAEETVRSDLDSILALNILDHCTFRGD